MNYPNFKLFLTIFFVFSFFGCKVQQHVQQTRSIYETPPFEIGYSVQIANESQVPPDVRMVTAAIVLQLRNDPSGIPNVSFDASGVHIVSEADFDYQGFSVTSVLLEEHWVHDTGNDSFICRVEGSLVFEDILGRRALNHFLADYELFSGKIVILNSVARPIDPIFPETQAFIVKAEDLQAIVNLNPDFTRFYTETVSRAVSMTPTPEERRLRQELEQMSLFERIRRAPTTERYDYFMIIFVMDRIMPDAGVEVVVTSSVHDRQSLAESVYRDFDGWRVAIFGGNFALDRDVFYAKTYYRPRPGILPDNLDQVLIGLFATEKNYKEQQHTVEMATSPSPQSGVQRVGHASAEGPLASGHVFLNPAKRDDARVIQTRLAELGFYNMAIDGLWGPGSRGALQGFQRSINITANGEWTMQSQMRLFSGTGK